MMAVRWRHSDRAGRLAIGRIRGVNDRYGRSRKRAVTPYSTTCLNPNNPQAIAKVPHNSSGGKVLLSSVLPFASTGMSADSMFDVVGKALDVSLTCRYGWKCEQQY